MLIISSNDNSGSKWVRLGAAAGPWAVKKPKTDVSPQALSPQVPPAEPPATVPPPTPPQPAPVMPPPPAPEAASPVVEPAKPQAQEPTPLPPAQGDLDSLANAFVSSTDMAQQEQLIDQILAAAWPYGKGATTVGEFLNNAARRAPKGFTGDAKSILFKALSRHKDPKRDKNLNFAQRLQGTVTWLGKEKDINVWSKSKVRNIWDDTSKDFVIPAWIQAKIPIPEHVTDPQAARHLEGQRAFEAYAWKNWEYNGTQAEGIDPNNPPSTFVVEENGQKVAAPWTRVRKAFNEFNRVTDAIMKSKGLPQVPPVNFGEGKRGHGDTKANYGTRYTQLGLFDPLLKAGITAVEKDAAGNPVKVGPSPFHVRGRTLDDAIRENEATGGQLEAQINAQLPPDQQVSLKKADWATGGRFWVRDEMVNPIRSSLSPSQLMNIRDIARQKKVSLDTTTGLGHSRGHHEISLKELIEDKGTTTRDLSPFRGTEIEPRLPLMDPVNDIMSSPLGSESPAQDRLKKKHFMLPLVDQVMEDFLGAKESEERKTANNPKYQIKNKPLLGQTIKEYIRRTRLPSPADLKAVMKELDPTGKNPPSIEQLRGKIAKDVDASFLDQYQSAIYKSKLSKYENEFGTRPSPDQDAAMYAASATEAIPWLTKVKGYADELLSKVNSLGAHINSSYSNIIPQFVKEYIEEEQEDAQASNDPADIQEAQLKSRIAELMLKMAPGSGRNKENVEMLKTLSNDPALAQPTKYEREEGKHLTPDQRLVHLVNEVSKKIMQEVLYSQLQAQAATFIMRQIRLAKFSILSSLMKKAV